MQNKIPKDIKNNYEFLSRMDKAYLHARWRLCPFLLIDKCLPQKGKIVDVGSGYGLLGHVIARNQNRKVYGIDLSKKRVDIARRSINGKKNLFFERKNVKDLKLGDCDGIVMSDFLHHISFKDQENLIRQARGKLKNGGILAIQDIDKKPKWKYAFAAGLDLILNGFPYLYYRRKENIKTMLERNGFQVEIVPADKGLPLPDILFICTKVSLPNIRQKHQMEN